MWGLLLGMGSFGKSAGGLFEAIAFAAELEQDAAVQEAVEDGGGEGGVAEKLVPILDDAV